VLRAAVLSALTSVAAVTGCSSAQPTTTSGMFHSGARLRARVVDGGGGAVAFVGWQDAVLETSCVLAVASDGSTRCLPASTQPAFFFDAACTERAATFSAGTTPPPFVSVADDVKRCDRRFLLHAFRVGEARATTRIYAGGGGKCGVSPLLPDEEAYALSPEVPPRTFVEARRVTEARGAGLDANVFVTDDGARQVDSAFDKQRGATCGVPRGINGELVAPARCIPLEGAYDGFYANATCTGERVAYTGNVEGCPAPTTAIQLRSTCDGAASLSLWALGPQTSAPAHYVSGAACETLAPIGLRLYPEVAPLDLAAFPALATVAIGSGRLRNVLLTASDDARALAEQRPGELFDTTRSAFCTPAAFADGSVRCIDDTAAALNGDFADDACTNEIALAGGRCAKPAYAFSQDASRAVVVTERIDATTVYRRSRGRCEARPAADGDVFWLTGAPTELDAAFPLVTERTE
jgi:hypothetical protein